MILFDLDGTLVDTAPDLGYALNLQRERHGLDHLPMEAIRPFASHGSKGLLSIGFDLTPEDKAFETMRVEYLDLYDQVSSAPVSVEITTLTYNDGITVQTIHPTATSATLELAGTVPAITMTGSAATGSRRKGALPRIVRSGARDDPPRDESASDQRVADGVFPVDA